MNPTIDYPPKVSPDWPPGVSASELIRRCLRERPSATPEEVAEWLLEFNIRLAPHVIDALLAAMKTG